MHRQGQKYRHKHETKRFVEFHNHLYALTMPKLSVIHIGFILEGHANLLKKYFEREDRVSVGAVAVETNTNICKNEHVESEVEEVDPVDSIDFLEIGGYVAKESVND